MRLVCPVTARFWMLFWLPWLWICVKPALAQYLEVAAGGGTQGNGADARDGRLDKPFAVTFDASGNMYIGEYGGCRVCKVYPSGLFGVIGGTGEKGFSGDEGPAPNGQFSAIHDVVVGPDGNLYIADTDNRRVRKINLTTNQLTTFAGNGGRKIAGDGGQATDASLDGVASLCFDHSGTTLYLTGFSKVVRAVDLKTGIIQTVKNLPGGRSLAADSHGNLYVAGGQFLRLRAPDGDVRTVLDPTHTGGSDLPLADNPKHLAIDSHDNVIICDEQHQMIRRYEVATGRLTTLVGTGKGGAAGIDGPAMLAQLNRPHGVYYRAQDSTLYIADSWNDRVVKAKIN